MRLTERIVRDRKKEKKPYTLWDAHTTGLGCKVYPSGRKSYVLSYRVGGRKHLATLGACSNLGLQEARDVAGAELVRIRDDKSDPLSRRRDARTAPTVDDAIARFFTETAPERIALGRFTERTARDYAHYARRYVAPAFGTMRVRDVSRHDVERLAATLTRTPSQRNRLLAFLSRLFNLTEDWEWRAQHSNPVRRVVRAREEPRDRVLCGEELAALSEALGQAEEHHPVAVAAIRVASLTGLRIGEIISMRWADIDLRSGRMVVPISKTGRRHHDLPAAALAIVKSRPHVNEWVFTSGKAALTYGWVRTVFIATVKEAGLGDVRLHDLRRTIITMAASSGISSHVLRDFLGHKSTAMADRYIRRIGDPVRDAREQVAAQIASMMGSDSGEGASAGEDD